MTEILEYLLPTIMKKKLLRKCHFTVLEVYKVSQFLNTANISSFFLKKYIKLRLMKSYLLRANIV